MLEPPGSYHEPRHDGPVKIHPSRSSSTENTIGPFILWIFLAPGEWVSDRLGDTFDQNRDLMRMLVNSLFWITVAVIGLAIWTSGMPIYR